jgi:hypothetical protein
LIIPLPLPFADSEALVELPLLETFPLPEKDAESTFPLAEPPTCDEVLLEAAD